MNNQQKIKGDILFREEQQFRVRWLWVLLLVIVASSIVLTIALPATSREDEKARGLALAIIIPLESILLYLFYIVKLETVVSRAGVYFRWLPFFKRYRYIDKQELKETKAGRGPALAYGFHVVPGFGAVHNLGPGMGMQFTLKKGNRIFIGTHKLTEFQSAIDRMVLDKK